MDAIGARIEGDLKGIKLEDWPRTDCSTSTRPVRDLVAYKLLGVPYKWKVDWMSGTTYIIQPDFSGAKTPFSYHDYDAKNHFSGTHDAYMNLMEGVQALSVPLYQERCGHD